MKREIASIFWWQCCILQEPLLLSIWAVEKATNPIYAFNLQPCSAPGTDYITNDSFSHLDLDRNPHSTRTHKMAEYAMSFTSQKAFDGWLAYRKRPSESNPNEHTIFPMRYYSMLKANIITGVQTDLNWCQKNKYVHILHNYAKTTV